MRRLPRGLVLSLLLGFFLLLISASATREPWGASDGYPLHYSYPNLPCERPNPVQRVRLLLRPRVGWPRFPVLAGDCRSCCLCDRPSLDEGLFTLCWETNQIFSGPEFIEFQGLGRRVLVAPRKLCSSGTMEIVCLLDSLESRSFPR